MGKRHISMEQCPFPSFLSSFISILFPPFPFPVLVSLAQDPATICGCTMRSSVSPDWAQLTDKQLVVHYQLKIRLPVILLLQRKFSHNQIKKIPRTLPLALQLACSQDLLVWWISEKKRYGFDPTKKLAAWHAVPLLALVWQTSGSGRVSNPL